ncbi:Ovary receptor kinase 11 [Heracleum sosnowskyi]|uniref:Ovary receptor kinase 11 n=1 Tax=Heracleum sosnowskyi TaxID=360622 RepID=A0AAD8IHX6_9APIA|nr:Ovary receptor kinase 11 [Heracleum sosnowskyi]
MNHCHYLLVGAAVFFSFLFTTVKPDLANDKAALIALRSAVGGRTLFWNATDSSPCKWIGVQCTNNRISSLRLPGMSLAGTIPEKTIGKLNNLVTLSLRSNALSGSLPLDLSSLSNLRNLYLQSNEFSGPIPTFIFSLKDMIHLNLASNNFSGPISSDFNKLNRLGSLYLEKNRLSGEIPNLDLPVLVRFNVSDNLLIGNIPEKLSSKAESAFVGNDLCGRPLKSCSGGGKKFKGKLLIGVIVGVVLVCLVGVSVVWIFVCLRRGGKNNESKACRSCKESEFDEQARGELVYLREPDMGSDLNHLLGAYSELLGKGAFGMVYKTTSDTEEVVAVKRLKEAEVAEKVYKDKIERVGSMDHENLVPLRAYLYGLGQNLLVYDYMPMGSLSALLHENRGAGRTYLNWVTRAKIALGAARGIAYIHSLGPEVSHGNIKSSNILLTSSCEARVSDIGLAQLYGPDTIPNRGYRAPEVTNSRKVSQKADVYSFGVLLLELLTGMSPTHAFLKETDVDLPRWVQSVVTEEWTSEVFDAELLKYIHTEDDMVQLLQLALACCDQYPDRRPTMTEVLQYMEELFVSH